MQRKVDQESINQIVALISYIVSSSRILQQLRSIKDSLSMPTASMFLYIVSLISCNILVVLGQSNLTEQFVNRTGGAKQYLSSIHQMEQVASNIRNGTPCHISKLSNWSYGSYGVVAPLTFDDGEKWAVKISGYPSKAIAGVNALKAIGRYCPELRVPKIWGEPGYLTNKTYAFYFMDWLEGRPLYDDYHLYWKDSNMSQYYNTATSPKSVTVRMHERTLTQLAEFLYNLTTCPIPDKESKSPSDLLAEIL